MDRWIDRYSNYASMIMWSGEKNAKNYEIEFKVWIFEIFFRPQ